MDRLCKHHGMTKFHPYRVGDKTKYRCAACLQANVQRRREKLKTLSIEYLGGCCQHCGYNKFAGALEFHHKDPTQKDFGISSSGHTRSWEKIKVELDKCLLLCANCHREEHGRLKLI